MTQDRCRHLGSGGPCCLNELVDPPAWCNACTEAVRVLRGEPKPPLEQDPNKQLWVRQLEAWRYFGTFDAIDTACAAGWGIKIQRSDGTIIDGWIEPRQGGFGGRATGVRFLEGKENRYKSVPTEAFIDLNPHLFTHLQEGYAGPRD